jgi:hypothetical protein
VILTAAAAAAALYLQGGDVQRDCLSRQDAHVTCKRVRDQTNQNRKTAGNSTEAQEGGGGGGGGGIHLAITLRPPDFDGDLGRV